MGINRNQWSKLETKKLIECVLDAKQNGRTDVEGFTKASNMLGRTKAACAYKFYKMKPLAPKSSEEEKAKMKFTADLKKEGVTELVFEYDFIAIKENKLIFKLK